jgi:hypothetical protein
MKKSSLQYLLYIFSFLTMVSCGFQGRKYTTGHYWEGIKSDEYESQKLKQSESKNKSVLEYSVQSKELIEQDSMENNSELDTLKIPLCRKKNHEALNNQVEVSDSLSPEMTVIKQNTELKIRRAKKGLNIFLGLEGVSILGLVINILDVFNLGKDEWGFHIWIILFALLIELFLLPLILYAVIYFVRKRRFKKKYSVPNSRNKH